MNFTLQCLEAGVELEALKRMPRNKSHALQFPLSTHRMDRRRIFQRIRELFARTHIFSS